MSTYFVAPTNMDLTSSSAISEVRLANFELTLTTVAPDSLMLVVEVFGVEPVGGAGVEVGVGMGGSGLDVTLDTEDFLLGISS